MTAPYSAAFEAIGASGSSRAETIARLDRLSILLDTAFVLPGTRIRFGLDGIIGLIPGIGDLVSTALSSYIIWEARRLGLPRWKIARMMLNTGIDAVVGVVPFLGDAVDVLFKANRRNMKILRDHLAAHDGRAADEGFSAGDGRRIIDAEYRVVRSGR